MIISDKNIRYLNKLLKPLLTKEKNIPQLFKNICFLNNTVTMYDENIGICITDISFEEKFLVRL